MKKNIKWFVLAIIFIVLSFVCRVKLSSIPAYSAVDDICLFAGVVCALAPAIQWAWETWCARPELEKKPEEKKVTKVEEPFVEGAASDASEASEPVKVEATSAPKRLSKKVLQVAIDDADDGLVDAERTFRNAEKAADDAEKAMEEYNQLLAAAKARRSKS